jgi:repressor LexA
MHKIQKQILKLAKSKDVVNLGYRALGKLIGVSHPQQVKHHLNQLIKKGYIKPDKTLNVIEKVKKASELQHDFAKIPVLGEANCGDAISFADEQIDGYIKVSKSLFNKPSDIFALVASGKSMNKADVKGKPIEDGDYVLIDGGHKDYRDGDYVLSIIDKCANIKKIKFDKKNKQIILFSESTEDIPPILIDSTTRPLIR